MTEQSVRGIERRLVRLERENRWFKRLASVAVVALVTLALMGQARPAHVPDVIEAKSFIVRDGNGQQRAKLGVEPSGLAGLQLYDPPGKVRAAFSVVASGKSAIELLDQAGNERLLLYVRADGFPGVTMQDETGNGRVSLAVGPTGPLFGLTGGGSANTARFLITTEAGVTLSLFDDSEKGRLALGVVGNTPILAIRDQTGKIVWKAP
jgi:hypothetical protein